MQMLFARYGDSRTGFTISVLLAPLPRVIARTCAAPGPWQFSQPMDNSENAGSEYFPFVPATELARPEWQKTQPFRIGRLNPKSIDSYPGEGPHLPGFV